MTKQLPAGFDAWSLREKLEFFASQPEARTPEGAALIEQWLAAQRENPLMFFEPHPAKDGRRPQMEFIRAMTKIVAAFAGNQFGKTTILTVCSLREVLPRDFLPPWLADTKRYDPPAYGWIFCPTEDKIFEAGGFKDTFEEWCPPAAFVGGNWGKAFNGSRMTLSFTSGSSITFKTYKQDASDLGGARLHFVGYDEPPPQRHREEGRVRLSRYGGYEMFAMTPLSVNTKYVRREVYKKRAAPHITVVRGSIHDNPYLDAETVNLTLGDMSDLWRRAREFGEFVDVGGLIYPDFDKCVVPDPWDPEFIQSLDVVVGIDPGIRNCGLVWVGFDDELVAHVFDAVLLQNKVAKDYAATIREVNSRWGLRDDRVSYVIDPAAKQRAQANGMTVLAEINNEGIYPSLGQNDHELGFGQMRTRMAHRRFLVSPEQSRGLLGLREEADEYAAKEPEEGRDDSHLEPIKGNDHRLDALRYAVMERFWDPVMEDTAPDRNLGWEPGTAPKLSQIRQGPDVPAAFMT